MTRARKRTHGPPKQRRRKKKSSQKVTAKTSSPTRKARARKKRSRQRIDAYLKGVALAAEPPIDSSAFSLVADFRSRLQSALEDLALQGRPFKLVEGFRTTERQQWLYGSGRPSVKPFGRPGPIVTNADGVTKKSKHQGDGAAGSGVAADCYPLRNGKVHIPASSDPVWDAFATAVEARGLRAGHRWSSLKDSPHCELG
jgi:hypothetical protein